MNLRRIIEQTTKEAYSQALLATEGNAVRAAKLLGVSHQAVYLAIRRYGLEDVGRDEYAGERPPQETEGEEADEAGSDSPRSREVLR